MLMQIKHYIFINQMNVFYITKVVLTKCQLSLYYLLKIPGRLLWHIYRVGILGKKG